MESDWATPSMMEFPFWRDGMTAEEFEEEREYFYRDEGYKDINYEPLWKQREKGI